MLDNPQPEAPLKAEPNEKGLYDKLFPEDTSARTSLTRQQIEITNRRYQDDPFWSGPKGLEYGLLLGAQPYQVANLYPDAGTSYFVGWFTLPKGAKLIITGEYGHLRYFSYTVATKLPNGQLGNGDFIVDENIQPDKDCVNPFDPDEKRSATPRRYTLHIVNGEAPKQSENRPKNTIFTGITEEKRLKSDLTGNKDLQSHLAFRNYLPDVGYDGTGNVTLAEEHGHGLPEVALEMDGKLYHGEEMRSILHVEKNAQIPGSSVTDWLGQVAASYNPKNAPALPPRFEPNYFQRFWNTNYSALGAFILDPEERVTTYPAKADGGLANNPDTVYMLASVSLEYGRVFVIKGKMPRHQKTRHGEETWEKDPQLRYLSATTGGSLPSGLGWATVYDEEIPVDDDGNFTIVVSWQEDRPKNARTECGIKWLDFGEGEGHYIGARNWVTYVYMRYQHMSKDWLESPKHIPTPTEKHPNPQDAHVMREYYPKSKYMSKADFENLGNNPNVTFNLPQDGSDES